MTWLLLAVAGVVVGGFIGAVGIGGVLLIPALMLLLPLDAHTASATALATFVFTGALGTLLFQRRGSIDWRKSAIVCAAAIAFSVVGAMAKTGFSGLALTRIIAVLILVAGTYIFLPTPSLAGNRQPDSPAEYALLAAIGALAGFGSGFSGAGGPLFSVPLMLIAGYAPLVAVGVSQVLQIVAALAGTAANLHYGSIAIVEAGWVTLFELAGVLLGVRIAHIVPPHQLRRIAAALCVVVGAVMLLRT